MTKKITDKMRLDWIEDTLPPILRFGKRKRWFIFGNKDYSTLRRAIDANMKAQRKAKAEVSK